VEYKNYTIDNTGKHYLVFKKEFKKVSDRFPLAICETQERAEQFIDELHKTKENLRG
jgi:hypothetical protein